MSVDAATVKRIGRLARIRIEENEVATYQDELNAILGFVEQLDEVDVDRRRADDLGDADAAAPPRGQGHRRRLSREDRRQRAADRGQFLRGAEGRGMTASRSQSRRRCRTMCASWSRQLNAHLLPLSPIEFQFKMTVEQMAGADTTVFVARDETGRAVGMGALKVADDGEAEVKRMFTLPEVRGQRVGSALLEAITDLARAEGRPAPDARDRRRARGSRARTGSTTRSGFTPRGAVLRLSRQRVVGLLREAADQLPNRPDAALDAPLALTYGAPTSFRKASLTDLTRLTLADARDGLRDKQFSSAELTGAYLAAIEKANPSLNAYVAVTPEQAQEMANGERREARGRAGRAARGHPARHQGPVRHQGRSTPRRRATSSTASSPSTKSTRHRQSLARRRGDAGQAQHGRVRHGLVQRDLLLRPGDQPVAGGELQRQPRARRLVGRLGRGGFRLALRRRRRRPTPAARSASRRRSPARSASSRPMAAARAGASSRSPPRSIRPGRSPAPSRMRRS